MGGAMMVAIVLRAKRLNLPRSHFQPTLPQAMCIAANALPAVFPPLIITGGTLLGLFTPTEAAVVAAAYAMLLGFFYYGELRISDLAEILLTTGRQTAQVMFIIAGAGIFGWVLIQQQIPNQVIEQLLAVSSTPWVLLLMVNIVLLVLGMFIEGIA